MREILFRGKRIDNGEWIEGSLLKVTIEKKTAHLIFGDDFSFDGNNVEALSHALIDLDTVGQYTGLNDKNGKKIFEGSLCLCDRRINDRFDKTVFKIMYDNEKGFYGESKSGNEIYADDFYMCETIGNIHDNPEILKEMG